MKQQRHKPDDLIASRGRRRFLIGAAGAALSLPFLESLALPERAGAWTAAPGMPRRLVIFFHGHGTIMEDFVPGPGNAYGPILRPIENVGLKDKTLVVTGVDMKVQAGHPGTPSLLTCTPLSANQHNITAATSASIDHVIARHMQDGRAARRLDLGLHGDSMNPGSNGRTTAHERTFWAGPNEVLETLIKPDLAFRTAFPGGSTTPPAPTGPTTDYAAVRRRSVLDSALQQFTALSGRVSASDRARLEQHADNLRAIEQGIETTVAAPPPPPASCTGAPELGQLTGLSPARVAELQVDILAHAIACNQADVGTFKFFDMEETHWGHISHPDLAQTFAGENYHGAWHRASDQRQAHARRAFSAIDTWFGEIFARFLSTLNQFDEGAGTALDNTMVLWVSDFGHGGGHASGNFHLVMAGNAGGASLGRHVNYASSPTSPWGADSNPGNHNLAVTMQNAFGISGDRFGNYSSVRAPVQPGPLSL